MLKCVNSLVVLLGPGAKQINIGLNWNIKIFWRFNNAFEKYWTTKY